VGSGGDLGTSEQQDSAKTETESADQRFKRRVTKPF
jgi:hypothetical protein